MQSITASRLQNQKIAGAQESAADLVRYMTAMQGQDYYGALWAIGLRTDLTEKEVITAVETAEIIRTWPHRGTLHYVTPEDAYWMVRLSGPKLINGASARRNNLALSIEVLEQAKAVFAEALKGGKRLTRPQMLSALEAAGISTANNRSYHILWYAAQTGLTYIGPMEGKQQTFGLLSDLKFTPRDLDREEAILELTTRYFTSHGPATVQDFMWWSGLTSSEVKAALAKSGLQIGRASCRERV